MKLNTKGHPGLRYDWRAIEEAFVNGENKLVAYSRDRTGLESSPPHIALRKRAAKYDWSGKRAQVQALRLLVPAEPEERQQVADFQAQVEKLVDTATVISDHLKLSQTMKSLYGAFGVKVKKAIDDLNPASLKPEDISRALSVMASLVHGATELDRKSLGLAMPLQVELTTRYVISMDPLGEPLSDDAPIPTLSREEWSDRYAQN